MVNVAGNVTIIDTRGMLGNAGTFAGHLCFRWCWTLVLGRYLIWQVIAAFLRESATKNVHLALCKVRLYVKLQTLRNSNIMCTSLRIKLIY